VGGGLVKGVDIA